MKVDFLEIRSRFKNLEGVFIDFDQTNLMTVVVGRNGSGKSNVLEALVSIFRNLDLGDPPPFSYRLVYRLGTGESTVWVSIDADPGRKPADQYVARHARTLSALEAGGKAIKKPRLHRARDGRAEFLPKYLFAYYSGPSDRLEDYFRRHRTDFYRRLLRNQVDLAGDIRPLFYAKPIHSQFVLLAFFLSEMDQGERAFLRTHLGITGLDSVHFVMRRPNWVRKPRERFWGADGVVREFLDRLYPLALAPVRVRRPETTSLTGQGVRNEFMHLFLPDLDSLRSFARNLSPDVFFKMLESTLLSEIISEVRVTVGLESTDTPLSFRELSEGEQQLLTVLGLLKFTGGADSLFLLDEPDTHLNPAWAVKYLGFLRDFVPNHETSHLLMVSHHPLAIAELEKEQIQVMWRDEGGQVHATEPAFSPRGMGYAGILTSDMFGLYTTLDAPTEDLIRQRRALAEKAELDEPDKVRLRELDQELALLGFSSRHWDGDYQQYLQIRSEIEAEHERHSPRENPEVHKRRREIAARIIRDLIERGDMEAPDAAH
ncbi:chromosome segregation protein SMC [Mesorhizobium sp. B2-4-15]|uniref:AAA family ATPase n=1 Tax=Mesorhizobium sp. B2-4-15 TaxID=2589934 RepID=UPI0011548586|nr:AAA family ATPase [Mesorhizobium sp. B2-4-15]TPK59703.1 chromosome segregation protein SMC [Mesorhizobium sp. B2-4-15]